jgi:hypothetical protein
MKRFVLAMILGLMLAVSAYGADCIAIKKCILWNDLNRFIKIAEIIGVEGVTPKVIRLMEKDAEDGFIISVPAGTSGANISPVDGPMIAVKIRGVELFGMSENFKCD